MQTIHKNKRKKHIFIYIIVIVLFIIINPFQSLDFIHKAFMIPLSPIIQVGFGHGSHIAEYTNILFNIGGLYRENQELIAQVRNLKSKNAYSEDVKKENEILRSELKLLPRDRFSFEGADVVMRDSLGGDQWLMINKGKSSGIHINKPVVVGEGILIGVIDEVNNYTARVKLITHPDSSINVVTARTGAEAIAYGNHGLSVFVEDIKKDDDVVAGDVFITSNIGNILPRGFSIGVAQDIESSENNLFHSTTMAPLVAFDDIRFVFVIK